MRRADRLFRIVLLLGRGKVQTAASLAGRLEVSERTVYRDIRDLVGAGVPIRGEAGVGYCLERGYQIPPMMFDDDELQVLAFGAEVARIWGDEAMGQAAERILGKVHAVLPPSLRPKLTLSRMYVPDFHAPGAITESLRRARIAARDQRRLGLVYRNGAGVASERIVWPLTLIYWGRTWTLAAWCELREDFRNFRIDRIQSAEVLDSLFPSMPGRTLEDYVASFSDESAGAGVP